MECITASGEVQHRARLARRFLPNHVYSHGGLCSLHPERRVDPSYCRLYAAGLRNQAILVRHFAGDRIADFLRISVGTEADNGRLIEAFHQLLR
jgi:hypothetical protein